MFLVCNIEEEDHAEGSKSDPGGQDETSHQSVQSSEPEISHPEEDSVPYVTLPEESNSKLESEVNEDSVTHPPDSEASSDIPAIVDESSVQSIEFSVSKQVYKTSETNSEAQHVKNDADAVKQEDVSKQFFQNFEEDSSKSMFEEDSSSKINLEVIIFLLNPG